MVIEATLDLGEAVVSGQVEPDQYAVVRGGERLRIGHRRLGARATVIRSAPQGGTQMFEEEYADRQALPDPVILPPGRMGGTHPESLPYALG